MSGKDTTKAQILLKGFRGPGWRRRVGGQALLFAQQVLIRSVHRVSPGLEQSERQLTVVVSTSTDKMGTGA